MNNLILILVLLSQVLNIQVYAVDSTESSTVESIEASIQDRIEKALSKDSLVEESEILNSATEKAFVGIVKSISQQQITITTNPDTIKEKTEIALLTSDSEITKASEGELEADEIPIGDYIIAIGRLDSKSELITSRVILDKFVRPNITREIGYVTINSIDSENETIILDGIKDLEDEEIDLADFSLLNQKGKKIDLEDITEGMVGVSIILKNNSKETSTLDSLIIFDQKVVATPTSNPSPSSKTSCGDGVCQNIVCQGLDCPESETPETCPKDCTE